MAYGPPLINKIYERSPIILQNIFVTGYGWRIKKKKYHSYFKKYWDIINRSQWYEEDKLAYIQTNKLRELIEYAYNSVPYYSELFDRLKLKPKDIKSISDLQKIPILEKNDIRNNWKKLLSRAYSLRNAIRYNTSGTTGTPLTIYISRNCYEREYAFRCLHYSWGGVTLGESYATIAGHPVVPVEQSAPPFWRYNYAEKQLIFSSQHISEETLGAYIEALGKFKPAMIHGYPSSIYLIAKYLVENNKYEIRPKAVFTASETLLDFQKETIEKAFSCKVFNWYGNTEMVAHATECPSGGLHVKTEHSVLEIVDKDGYPVQGQKEGIIIGTGLDNWAMPIIRLRVGDVAIPQENRCNCGRKGPLLKQIVGREEDYVITPEGRKVGRLDHVFKSDINIKESQIIQNVKDKIIIRVVKDNKFSDKDIKIIIDGMQERLGYSMEYEFEFLNKIPRENNGKFKFVKNNMIN